MKILTVIPTTGSPTLRQAVESVLNQSYAETEVLVVVDGPEFENSVNEVLSGVPTEKLKIMVLPYNTGADGFYGHRIYASISCLVDHDYISFLDQDNWYKENHIESLLDSMISKKVEWAYSLRQIYDTTGNYVCDDNCESLGKWPIYLHDSQFLIDTSSFLIKRDILLRIGMAIYSKWGADRQFYAAIKQYFPDYVCSGKYTLNYRLAGNANSVTKEFFENGNAVMHQRYPNGFPWVNGDAVEDPDAPFMVI